jgi:hypothetical protein
MHIRGRSGLPLTRLRIRAWRFWRAASLVFFTSLLLAAAR